MSELDSTPSTARHKPAKPYPEFPLFPHSSGHWAKKIRGRMHYFGRWDGADDGHQAALTSYNEQKDDLHAGREPREPEGTAGVSVKEACNRFMASKRLLVDAGELMPRSFAELHGACVRVVKAFGKGRAVNDLSPRDFDGLRASLAKTLGPVALGNAVQRVRSVFKFAYDAGLIDRPVRFGPSFKKPPRRKLRLARAARGPRMFEADELRRMIAAAGVPLKAMILLGVNCGFGNADVGTLPLSALNLDSGSDFLSYPRPKTGIERRCPLWPETVAALRAALAQRPTPKDPRDAGLAFITKYGGPWHKTADLALLETNPKKAGAAARDNPVSKELAKLLKSLGLHRPGRNFYALRHVFETVGGEARDQVAVDHIMGHAREDMASVYRERISDARLKAVTDHVRGWLLPPAGQAGGAGA
jgi:integrase